MNKASTISRVPWRAAAAIAEALMAGRVDIFQESMAKHAVAPAVVQMATPARTASDIRPIVSEGCVEGEHETLAPGCEVAMAQESSSRQRSAVRYRILSEKGRGSPNVFDRRMGGNSATAATSLNVVVECLLFLLVRQSGTGDAGNNV